VLLNNFYASLCGDLKSYILKINYSYKELTLVLRKDNMLDFFKILKNKYFFTQLIDITGVDYLHYGVDEWSSQKATSEGFSRGIRKDMLSRMKQYNNEPRFAVVYHLLNLSRNLRLRLKIFFEDNSNLTMHSLTDIWSVSEWYEREAFDMFGFIFLGNPDLRRILTDYGFSGYPLRKDFPQSGNVSIRYSEEERRIVYEDVEIDPRVNIPKVIRKDNRYKDC